MTYRLLNKIDEPWQLKDLTLEELKELAGEVRTKIVDVVSQKGGHLAPSLGVVELTVALYSVFDLPKDKVIWDCGHQGYPHKLLTGRRELFHTLRQYNGLSGFLHREESPYDVWGAGHASTSLSAALGFAKARDLVGGDERIISIVGDGALTGGPCLEALNNIGHHRTNMIVILNDNEFSISRNVGALTHYLRRLRTLPQYRKAEIEIREILKNLPVIGSSLNKVADQVEAGLQFFTIPGKTGIIFEEFGFKYFGPVDGHDINTLRETFKLVKNMEGPILIHAVTVKGKGLDFAEKDACVWHGVTPFDSLNGKMEKKSGGAPAYTKVFGDTLIELAKDDDRVIAITAAMPDGTGTKKFGELYPDRFFDVGIAETHAVIFAAGLSLGGLKPVVAVYSTFLQRAYDAVLHDVCLQNVPVVFALDRAGIVGADGATHQGVFDLSYLRMIPNICIMAPKDEGELRNMLKTALHHNGPVAVRFPRGEGIGAPIDVPMKILPVGKAELLLNGEDVAILAVGSMVYPSLNVAKKLKESGIDATVVNMRFVKPMDEDLLVSLAKRVRYFVTVEENIVAGGFGSGVMEFFARERFHDIKILPIGIPDEFIEHGAPSIIMKNIGLDEAGIERQICEFLNKEGTSSSKMLVAS